MPNHLYTPTETLSMTDEVRDQLAREGLIERFHLLGDNAFVAARGGDVRSVVLRLQQIAEARQADIRRGPPPAWLEGG